MEVRKEKKERALRKVRKTGGITQVFNKECCREHLSNRFDDGVMDNNRRGRRTEEGVVQQQEINSSGRARENKMCQKENEGGDVGAVRTSHWMATS